MKAGACDVLGRHRSKHNGGTGTGQDGGCGRVECERAGLAGEGAPGPLQLQARPPLRRRPPPLLRPHPPVSSSPPASEPPLLVSTERSLFQRNAP
eukprot:1429098-Rhodomonas_salina.2